MLFSANKKTIVVIIIQFGTTSLESIQFSAWIEVQAITDTVVVVIFIILVKYLIQTKAD